MPSIDIQKQQLLRDFKAFYSRSGTLSPELLERLYTQDIEYHDPERNLLGILALKQHLKSFHDRASLTGLHFLDEICTENAATLTWQAQVRRPGKRGKAVTLRGVTQLRFTDRIYYHEDFYDLGAAVYRQIPVLGPLLRLFRRYSGA